MNTYFKIIFGIYLAVMSFTVYADISLAQGFFTDNLGDAAGRRFSSESLFRIINGLACRFIQLAIIGLTIAIVVYGFMFFKSRGNPSGMSDAKKGLTWALVGGLVIMGVFTIIMTVASVIGVDYPITTLLSCAPTV